MTDILIVTKKISKKELKQSVKKRLYFKNTAKKWFQLSLSEQLANIGSEVARAIKWRQEGEKEHLEKALERALELFDLTLSDPRWRARAKEIARVRELVGDFFYGGNQYNSDSASLDRYFLYFALAARLHK